MSAKNFPFAILPSRVTCPSRLLSVCLRSPVTCRNLRRFRRLREVLENTLDVYKSFASGS